MDTALVIMIMSSGDNHNFRNRLKEMRDEGQTVYWTIEDYQRIYKESGWEAENELL